MPDDITIIHGEQWDEPTVPIYDIDRPMTDLFRENGWGFGDTIKLNRECAESYKVESVGRWEVVILGCDGRRYELNLSRFRPVHLATIKEDK